MHLLDLQEFARRAESIKFEPLGYDQANRQVPICQLAEVFSFQEWILRTASPLINLFRTHLFIDSIVWQQSKQVHDGRLDPLSF